MKQNLIGTGHRLGILGGGQLGRMFIQEAISYNIHVHIMDSNETSPCYNIATSFTAGDINNYDDVLAFGSTLDVLTVEIENVNIEALYALEEKGVKVFPQPRVLEIIKDKGLQKEFYRTHGIPTSGFSLINENSDPKEFISQLPFVQKLRTGGYDGRGVEVMKSSDDFSNFFQAPSLIEELIPFEKELSVIVARNEQGQTAVYPTVECEFNDVNLVEYLFSPADITNEIEEKAKAVAVQVINSLDMTGILAVELFLTKDGEILVNEVAPRPHNSGHHTIECNITSQFEQHMRSVLNMPLGSTKMTRFGAMINVLGSEGYTGKAIYVGLNDITAKEGVHVHLYGKEETKPHRKMGHVTVTGSTLEEAKERTSAIKGHLSVIA